MTYPQQAKERQQPMLCDNQALRALFTLPSVQPSASTALTVPEMPAQQTVTGDREVDAVLWLREVIKTAHPPLIDRALEGAKRIKTPMAELEKRYTDFVARTSGGHFGAVLMTFGFGDLKGLAKKTLIDDARKHEALARFGTADALFKRTAAEKACADALRGLKPRPKSGEFDAEKADARFTAHPDLLPHTLADVLHAQQYGSDLYWLRAAVGDGVGDAWAELSAYDDYAMRMLARIPPRDTAEALTVFEWLNGSDKMEICDSDAIMRNLIAGPGATVKPSALERPSDTVTVDLFADASAGA